MDDVEQEPIFDLAVECENLYARQITAVNDAGDENAAQIISDVYQRFAAWAAFMGVFAESNICLDRRLRRHVEIQDQVLRLLDIMLGNLNLLLAGDDSAILSQSSDEADHRDTCINMHSLEAISGALERLNQLGSAIRRSSVTDQVSKARTFAEKLDLTSFEQIASIFLRYLYPDASSGLLEHLTRSMAESYALFLHRRGRKERLQVERPQRKLRYPLRLIEEEPAEAANTDPMDFNLRRTFYSDDLGAIDPPAPVRPLLNVPRSEPTSIDTQELKARVQRLLSPRTANKPVSILVNQANYPLPSKESVLCDWCFNPLTSDSHDKLKWHEHVNEDFKPYVCLSENCASATPRFASSRQWFQHMVAEHGESWPQEVYAPTSSICPLCTESEVTFPTSDGLSEHLLHCHQGIFKEGQVRAIVRQSIFPVSRQRNACLLCCFPIVDERYGTRKQQSIKNDHPDQDSTKRLKTDAGYAQGNKDNEEGQSSSSPTAQTVASHVASHLQNVMLLTMRLISMEGATATSTASGSDGSDTDDQASWISTRPKDEPITLGFGSNPSQFDITQAPGLHGLFDSDQEIRQMEVPDSEPLDWDNLLGKKEHLAEHEPIADGFQTHHLESPTVNLDELSDHARGHYEVIRTLLDSEYALCRVMGVVTRIYKVSSSSCPGLSPEDTRIIFHNSDSMDQFAQDFSKHLREVAMILPFPNAERSQSSLSALQEINRARNIGEAFLGFGNRMTEAYVQYAAAHHAADRKLREVEMIPSVNTWLKHCQATTQSLYSPPDVTDLSMLLAMPMQHIKTYPKILESLLALMPEDHPARAPLAMALDLVKKINHLVIQQLIDRGSIRELFHIIRSGSSKQTRRFQLASWRSQKAADIPDPSNEYVSLLRRFQIMGLRVHAIISSVQEYLRSDFAMPVYGFLATAAAMDELLSPQRSSSSDNKWRSINEPISSIKVNLLLYESLITRDVLTPLITLCRLLEGPQKLMEFRQSRLPQYVEWVARRGRGKSPSKEQSEAAEQFKAVTDVLKLELPRLEFLTIELVHHCELKLATLDSSLFKAVQDSLLPLIDSFPDSFQQIMGVWEGRYAVPKKVAERLTICNRSLWDTDLDASGHNPDGPGARSG
ncbi:hypothetical protein BDV18DRAFT_159134 [Aspergillus unguis]